MSRITLFLFIWILFSACGGAPERRSGSESHQHDHDHDHDDDHAHEERRDTVEMSPEAQTRAGIEVQVLQRGALATSDRFVGTVQPMDNRVAHIRPLARGRLVQVLASVGDRVSGNQRLAAFDNIEAGEIASQLEGARAEVARLGVQRTLAHKQTERSRALFEAGAIPAKVLETAEAEAKAMDEAERAAQSVVKGLETRLTRFGAPADGNPLLTEILSPFAGVVTQSEAAIGETIDPGTVLFSIADLSRVYVEAQVYEKDLGRVRIGQKVLVTVDAFPEKTFEGRVAAVKHILDPRTRTATVRCEVPNPQGLLKLEMFAAISMPGPGSTQTLLLPATAIQNLEGRQVAFRRTGPKSFEAREVSVRGSGPLLELVSGLDEGDQVVVRGAFQLKSVMLASELESEHSHD